MIIFLSGPMTGLPDYNRPEFNRIAAALAAPNRIILSPAVLPDGMPHASYMTICKAMIDVADAVVAMPGWQDSNGAQEEKRYSRRQGKDWYELIKVRPDIFQNPEWDVDFEVAKT